MVVFHWIYMMYISWCSPPGSSALGEPWLPLWASALEAWLLWDLPPAALSTGVISNIKWIKCKLVMSPLTVANSTTGPAVAPDFLELDGPQYSIFHPVSSNLQEAMGRSCCFLRFWPDRLRESLDRGTNPWLSSSAKALSLWRLMASLCATQHRSGGIGKLLTEQATSSSSRMNGKIATSESRPKKVWLQPYGLSDQTMETTW